MSHKNEDYESIISKGRDYIDKYRNVEDSDWQKIETLVNEAEKEKEKDVMRSAYQSITVLDKNQDYEPIISKGRDYIERYRNVEGSDWQKIEKMVNEAKKIEKVARKEKEYEERKNKGIEMKKIIKLGFFPRANERGLTSYFPEVSFKLHNAGNQPITIKKVIVTYLHSLDGGIIYVQRIPFNKTIKPGEDTTTIKSISSYGFSKIQLFNILADQYDPTLIGGDTGDAGDSIIALIQVDEMEGTREGWPASFRNKWLKEGYRH